MLEESDIEGGDFMEILAQRLRDEGKKIGYEKGEKKDEKKQNFFPHLCYNIESTGNGV
jgi:hypothetical protein